MFVKLPSLYPTCLCRCSPCRLTPAHICSPVTLNQPWPFFINPSLTHTPTCLQWPSPNGLISHRRDCGLHPFVSAPGGPEVLGVKAPVFPQKKVGSCGSGDVCEMTRSNSVSPRFFPAVVMFGCCVRHFCLLKAFWRTVYWRLFLSSWKENSHSVFFSLLYWA